MPDKRRSPRYRTLARAWIPGILEGENLLKDLSITGCCVESTIITDILPNVQYELEIEPEGASHIRKFQLLVEYKWKRGENYSSEIGFCIVASPKGKQFQHYVDYLAYRNSLA